jgi:hypothetical protein
VSESVSLPSNLEICELSNGIMNLVCRGKVKTPTLFGPRPLLSECRSPEGQVQMEVKSEC